MSRRTYTVDGRLGRLVVRGAGLKADVGPLVTKATLSLSASEVSELRLTIADDETFTLLRSNLFEPGTTRKAGSAVDYDGLKLEVRAVEVTARGEDPTVTVTARSLGAGKLKRQTGALVRRNLSPTTFAHQQAHAAGLKFVGEPSAKRPTITRAGGDSPETSWDTIGRLARELGYVTFEAAGVLYFGRPTYLVQHTRRLPVAWLGDNAGRNTDDAIIALPTCRRTADSSKRVASVSVQLLGEAGDKVLPGMALDLSGVPTFSGRYMVTAVTIDLDDSTPVSVDAESPVNPEPEPPEKAKDGTSSAVKTPRAGSYAGTRFTSAQLGNATAIYRYGRAVPGATERDLVVAIAAAMQESSLTNLKGGDRDSAGLFQQRPSQGWGTHAQVTTVKYAVEAFLKGVGRTHKGLLDYDERASWSVAKAAQMVQRSGHPSAYARWEAEARAIIKAIKATASSSSSAVTGAKSAESFVRYALDQAGDRYVFGAEARSSDADPDAFDCSELVEWALARAGVKFVDGSANQRRKAKTISVAEGKRTRGALLFHPGHVAISLGNGDTIEAMNRRYGVRKSTAGNRFTSAGLVPGLRY